MLLAAGLGTRLRPLTDHTPKALIEIGGVPILERIAKRLIAAGVDRLIINTHHFARRIERFVTERRGWGIEVVFSPEEEMPLETGGALLRARPLFRGTAPFFLHNADILTDLDLAALYAAQAVDPEALATLAVMERPTSRHLLFDDLGLCGRTDDRHALEVRVRTPVGEERKLAFGGVHVISPALPALISERGAFSILEPYLRLAAEGYRIRPFRVDAARWVDIGAPEQVARAEAEFAATAER